MKLYDLCSVCFLDPNGLEQTCGHGDYDTPFKTILHTW